ncbi:MAG TPA: LOG family protein [Nitrospira sp.]|nr:LOG family protein [Nitrospira sp.]
MRHASRERQRLQRLLKSGSYRRADQDLEFLNEDELRPVRLQLELLKAELIQQREHIRSTIVVFGSARLPEPSVSRRLLARASAQLARKPRDASRRRAVAVAKRQVAMSKYYDEARAFGRLVSSKYQSEGQCDYVIVTGGGPGIMEAANRGAADVNRKSMGLNIALPHEQRPNVYITPALSFQFRYFALRKMHFLLRAKALVAFPGGFGTCDELFETLTLLQTGKVSGITIVLVGQAYWSKVIDWQLLEDNGFISPEDRKLFHYAETAKETWTIIVREQRTFRRRPHPPRWHR